MKHVCPDDPVLLKEFNDEVNRLKVVSATRTGAWRPPADARTKSEPELPGPEPELPQSEHGAAGSGPGAVEPAGLWYRLPEEHEHARSTPTTPAAANLSGGWDVEETSKVNFSS